MVCPAGRARPVSCQAEENAVRKCAYLKHVFAKSAWAFILSRRYDRLDIRCLRLYRNTAAETVRRVKRVLKAALVIFKAEKHINEYRLMPALSQSLANARARYQRDMPLRAYAAAKNHYLHSRRSFSKIIKHDLYNNTSAYKTQEKIPDRIGNFFLYKQLCLLYIVHRSYRKIILQRRIVQAQLDNLSADGIKIISQELRELLLEEVGEYLRAGVKALEAELGLKLRTQEGLADVLSVDLHPASSRTAGSGTSQGASCARCRCGGRGIRG